MRITWILIAYFCLAPAVVEIAGADEIQPGGPWKIVNYWSLWCAPCRVEIPELNQLSRELKSSDVVIVGINFDEDPFEKTLLIAERMGIEFPVLTSAEVEQLHLKAPDVLPTTYILSPDNKVKAKLIGPQDRTSLKAKLAEVRNANSRS